MRFPAIISLGLAAYSTLTSSAPTSDDLMLKGVFNPTPLVVSGSVAGGPEFTFTGGLKEVIPKIKELNPQWEGIKPTKTTSPIPSRVNELTERYFSGRPTCWAGPFDPAIKWAVEDIIIPHLNGLPASVMCGTNAYSCSQLYCDVNSSAWLCNLRSTKLDITCKRAAGAIQEICNDCYEFFDGEDGTQGMWADTTGYYITVQGCH